MIRGPYDLWPRLFADEVRRLAGLPWLPAVIEPLGYPKLWARFTADSFLSEMAVTGSEVGNFLAAVAWVKAGPKIARVTEEQYQVLQHVDVRLELADFTSPYPTLLVDLPPGHMHKAVIVYQYRPDICVAVSYSYDSRSDIVTLIYQRPGHFLEETLEKYGQDCDAAECAENLQSLRVAFNMALALSNFGCHADYLLPKEVERDRKLASEQTERGKRARQRLRESPRLVTFDREVVLHATRGHTAGTGEPTGGEKSFHWRRGHWAMVACGASHTERRRVLRRPCMVRADLLAVDESDTTTTYRSRP